MVEHKSKIFIIANTTFDDILLNPIEPEVLRKHIEALMKKFNIPKQNIVADYKTLKYLFPKS